MEMLNQIASRIDLFLLIVARVSGIFITGPLFSNKVIPRQVKILLTLIISMLLVVGLHLTPPIIPNNIIQFTIMFMGEMIVGLTIGFVASLTFAAVQLAGQLIDMQMGFGIVNVMDPIYGSQAPMMGSFHNLLALLLFLATNGHHYMIAALYESYQKIPIFGLSGGNQVSQLMVDLFQNMLVAGLKLAMPVVGALFVAEVALGIIARTMPEMQVYFVGMPAKIFLGFALLIMVLPMYLTILQLLFDGNYSDILRVLELMG